MLREEDVIREMELYGADTEELWEGKFSQGKDSKEGWDAAEKEKSTRKSVGVIGISPKAGASFIAKILMREMLWRENGPNYYPEGSFDRKDGKGLCAIRIIDLGEMEADLRSLDFLIVVEDGRGFSLEEENNRARMIVCLRRLGIPFQMVVNREEVPREADAFSVYFPLMDFRPAEKLFEILDFHFSGEKKGPIH